MTHEEMIEQLENTILLIKQNGKDWWDERDIPILEEAIKAMQTQLKESPEDFNKDSATESMLNADLISRQAVHDMLENLPITVEDKWFNWLQKACIRLAKLPSVQPEQRTGHWIDTGNYFMGAYRNIDYVECSCCHEDSLEEGDYCPNCGAKMEGSE